MKFLIVIAAVLGASMAAPEARGKRGLVSSLGYGIGPSLDLSSLHLPLASSVVAAPAISSISAPTVISSPGISAISTPTVIKSVHSPVVHTVVSQPHIVNYAPSLGLSSAWDSSLALSSGIPSISGLHLGGLPLTSHVDTLNTW